MQATGVGNGVDGWRKSANESTCLAKDVGQTYERGSPSLFPASTLFATGPWLASFQFKWNWNFVDKAPFRRSADREWRNGKRWDIVKIRERRLSMKSLPGWVLWGIESADSAEADDNHLNFSRPRRGGTLSVAIWWCFIISPPPPPVRIWWFVCCTFSESANKGNWESPSSFVVQCHE